MFFKKKSLQQESPSLLLAKLVDFLPLIFAKDANPLDSLSGIVSRLGLTQASCYLFEAHTQRLTLMKWIGDRPEKFSISFDYELVQHLQTTRQPLWRDDFQVMYDTSFRAVSLRYFQMTQSNFVLPLWIKDQFWGHLHFSCAIHHRTYCQIYASVLAMALCMRQQQERISEFSELKNLKAEIISNITHEWQTPLNGILGFAEVLLEDPETPTSIVSGLQAIKSSAKGLQKTLTAILELTAIEAKKNHCRRESVPLDVLLNEVLPLYTEACMKKGIKLVFTPVTPWRVLVNPEQIRTVLINLMGNAVKFTLDGEIKVSVEKHGPMVQIAVSDSGTGIDETTQPLVFEEFYQGDGSHTRLFGGTGLGLAIVKKIITQHSGQVWVESRKGVGSTFTFTLPLAP